MNDKTLLKPFPAIVAICICTRRRQKGLTRLLESIEKLVVPPGIVIKIIVVENDSENLSENIVNKLASRSKFNIRYYLESCAGLVYARNRSVLEAGNADFICFTDDDEIVTSDWLQELLKCQAEFDADGIAGPTWPYFNGRVQPYIEKFYRPDTYPYGTKVKSAFTGNLLIKKKVLDILPGPFDIRLNYSGGEDSYMTMQIVEQGGVICFNPHAITYEFVDGSRTQLRYIITRTFRKANTRLYINSFNEHYTTRFKVFLRLLMRLGLGLLIILPFLIFAKRDKLKGLIKIVNAAGGLAFVFGIRSQFYKQI